MSDQRDRIAVELTNFASGTTQSTNTGSGFTFDPDTIREVINNYKDLADSYAESVRDARPMAMLTPSADEFVSESFAAKANTSGTSYIAYCHHYADFYLREAQKCQDALDAYLGVEAHTVIELGNAGSDSRPPV
ncbi:PE domain-containing protein [Actinophytocola sp.]|uniref:PE domain-containing protein n=1 Tax=Actinophytocola sp. TaxID=1872138 RepID=UPI002D40000E|nr:PE domain-containing protein [Actinophytocola sp.]HYQ67194.1 PE domain-containing protein [Actinophytocola sp.]